MSDRKHEFSRCSICSIDLDREAPLEYFGEDDLCITCGAKEFEKVEAELKVTFDNMMRYMMFIRDNGYTTEYTKYAKEKGYE
tara:strand:- start:1735 stop:1980 length:246 start_codon:yes stop_codon:yes gene_type:complete